MCGTPIVTYNSGGSAELVLEGETGYVVKPLDVEETVSALKSVYDGKISREACARFALVSFEKTNNYRKYLDLYHRIYERKGRTNG